MLAFESNLSTLRGAGQRPVLRPLGHKVATLLSLGQAPISFGP